MAERIIRQFTDDVSGVTSDEDPTVATRYFSFDGRDYELDASDDTVKLMSDALYPFLAAARQRARRISQREVPRTSAARQRSREIRKWAEDQGIQIQSRGRIPGEIVAQFEAVH